MSLTAPIKGGGNKSRRRRAGRTHDLRVARVTTSCTVQRLPALVPETTSDGAWAPPGGRPEKGCVEGGGMTQKMVNKSKSNRLPGGQRGGGSTDSCRRGREIGPMRRECDQRRGETPPQPPPPPRRRRRHGSRSVAPASLSPTCPTLGAPDHGATLLSRAHLPRKQSV